MATYQEVRTNLGKALKKAPKPFRKYRNFADEVWSGGSLDPKTKEIIAVAVTHVTKCSYCVDYHTKKAKEAGASVEELVEAAVISASIQAYPLPDDEEHLREFSSLSAEEFFTYPINEDCFHLDGKTKTLIGLSISYALKSRYHIALFKEQAVIRSISEEEIKETSRIASALLAGAAIRHIDEVLLAYGE
ncbi:AhpD family alkylhydroperoxidase [Bacillus tianshenii]|uniref:AhpD family alkylhydroperoxidase n=1 Tax=Sutcliffiella tianshenii TaxID=1463404 RepID=A0ABS2P513_9BACI|nr:carboxymuconolactone decarboxylase family protein [Bacillus tianshenii]MBM7621951.1 AhpD family alkylhydroperoxidase [Bacillus tianshenii]